MTINIFGREIVFEIKEKSRKESSIILSNKKFINRFIWSVLVFFAFGIIIEFSKLGANYTVGSVAPSDIIAYKDVIYTVDILDKGIKEKIMKNTTPEYDKISSVPEEAVVAINNFFRDIKTVDLSNDQSISNFIRDNRYNLTVKDFKGIVERESVGYVVNLITIIKEIYEVGIVKTEDFDHIIDKNNIKIDDLDKKFLKNFIKPNLKINDKKTMEKIEDNLDSLKDKEIKIYKGDIIVKKGDVIDVDDYEKLEKLNLVRGQDKVRKVAGLIITFVLVSALFYYLTKKYSKKVIESKAFYPSLLIIIMVNILYVLFFNNEFYIYLLPFATIPIILTILGDKVFALTYTFFNMILLSRDETWFLVIVAVTLVAIYRADKLTNRSDIVKLGVFTGMFQGIMSLSYGLISQLAFPILIIMIIFSVFSGILTGMIALGILPYLENSFDILTDIKLLELSDFSHTLLKQLLVTAPGTFHHSIMVGALAEAGAEAIGANATFARVASYYHDIGKMKRPLFFVENQKGGKNPHNTIKPSLSALIITSHTRDGYIIGKQNKLPKEILDIILEHHGTTLVQFFYYKALEKGEEVLESDFRYSGPKPKTKESSIIFLADTIEAAVRASEDKSREGIDDNQLSNSNLTLGEIEKVIRAFLNVLQGAYHERIKYPKLDENSEKRVK